MIDILRLLTMSDDHVTRSSPLIGSLYSTLEVSIARTWPTGQSAHQIANYTSGAADGDDKWKMPFVNATIHRLTKMQQRTLKNGPKI